MTTPLTSVGAQEILSPDLGLLLEAESESWPDVLRQDEVIAAIRWIRDTVQVPESSSDAYGADRALWSALQWRVDHCVKLLLHIGWQWRTATMVIEETVEASKPERLETSRQLARQKFKDRADHALPISHLGSGELPQSLVLQATDDQLTSAFISLYEKSRAFHFHRLNLAKSWWKTWRDEARIVQWQASALSRWNELDYVGTITHHVATLYEVLEAISRLCQPTRLYESMQGDGALTEEIIAPDVELWTPTLTSPVQQFFNALLNGPELQDHRETIKYWMSITNLPADITKPMVETAAEVLDPATARISPSVYSGLMREDYEARQDTSQRLQGLGQSEAE